MTGIKRWACPSCGKQRTTAYCQTCGEERLRPRDLTSRDLVSRMFHTFTDIDGRLLRSFKVLVLQPGTPTLDYVRGRRRPYLPPLQLFLIANALFFAIQSLTHIDIFSSPLASHLHHQDWSPLARDLVARRLEARHLTLDAYAPLFDHAATLNAKALIILMALAFTPFVAALFHTRHQPIGAHLVFSLHLYVIVLLLFCLSLLAAETSLLVGGPGLDDPRVDTILSLFNLAVCSAYLFAMLGAVHKLRGPRRWLTTIALVAVLAVLVPGYRFAIFVVTLYTT